MSLKYITKFLDAFYAMNPNKTQKTLKEAIKVDWVSKLKIYIASVIQDTMKSYEDNINIHKKKAEAMPTSV